MNVNKPLHVPRLFFFLLHPDIKLSVLCVLQLKYKQSLKTDSSLYHHMPETLDTQFARQQTELLSEVRLYGMKPSHSAKLWTLQIYV